jgi:hypothetical protein
VRVEPPQRTDAQVVTKLVQDRSRGHPLPIGQPRKAPPSALLVQQLDQQIERVNWSQQHQEQQTGQLRRSPQRAATLAAMRRQQLIDESVGHKI